MRQPIVAGRFYSAGRQSCLAHLARIDPGPGAVRVAADHPVAAIVPHAGWDCSGRVAMKVLRAIEPKLPPAAVFVIFGAVHSYGLRRAAVYTGEAWQTPLGPLAVDAELAALFLKDAGDLLDADPAAHENEHSIEVQLPLIQHVFGQRPIVPIAAPPRADSHLLGRRLAEVARASGRPVFFLGTTDLTHYGQGNYGFAPHGPGRAGLEWAKQENDPRIIRLMETLQAEQVVAEAAGHHNACGAGAVAATVAAAKELGAECGEVVEYTTSYDVLRAQYGDRVTDFVGYVGVVF